MTLRITVIEDSRESQVNLLRTISLECAIEMQAITAPPFFDNDIETAISKFTPDLIILDLLLMEDPDSGFRVLLRLKDSATLSAVPVVVCSKFIAADPKDNNRHKALAYGAVEALPKIPFPKAEDFVRHARNRRKERTSSNQGHDFKNHDH